MVIFIKTVSLHIWDIFEIKRQYKYYRRPFTKIEMNTAKTIKLRKLEWREQLIAVLSLLLAAGFFILYFLTDQKLRSEYIRESSDRLHFQAKAIAGKMFHTPPESGNSDYKGFITENDDISYPILFDPELNRIFTYNDTSSGNVLKTDISEIGTRAASGREIYRIDDDFMEIFLPVRDQDKTLGYLLLGKNLHSFNERSAELLDIFLITFIIILITGLTVIWFFARMLDNNIRNLRGYIDSVAKGTGSVKKPELSQSRQLG